MILNVFRTSSVLDAILKPPDNNPLSNHTHRFKSNPTSNNPATEDPTKNDHSTDDPTTIDPTTEDPTTIDPTTDDPTTIDPATDDPTTIEPATEDPTTNEPSKNRSSSHHNPFPTFKSQIQSKEKIQK